MAELLSAEDVADRFFWHVRRSYRNQREAARHYGVSVAFVSAVTTGKRAPNKQMLADMGLAKVTGYVEAQLGAGQTILDQLRDIVTGNWNA